MRTRIVLQAVGQAGAFVHDGAAVKDQLLDGQSVSLGDFFFDQTVVPGGNYWQTNSVTLPMANSGSYTLFVQADVSNQIFEANKANNISAPVSGALTLTFPDLTVNLTVDNAFDLYVSTNDSVAGTLVTSGGNCGTNLHGDGDADAGGGELRARASRGSRLH